MKEKSYKDTYIIGSPMDIELSRLLPGSLALEFRGQIIGVIPPVSEPDERSDRDRMRDNWIAQGFPAAFFDQQAEIFDERLKQLEFAGWTARIHNNLGGCPSIASVALDAQGKMHALDSEGKELGL